VAVAHYSGGSVNRLFAVGQYEMHSFEISANEKYLETWVRCHLRTVEKDTI